MTTLTAMGSMVGCTESPLVGSASLADAADADVGFDTHIDGLVIDTVPPDVAIDSAVTTDTASGEDTGSSDSANDADTSPETDGAEDAGDDTPSEDTSVEEPPVLGSLDPNAITQDDALFPLGVQSGDALPTGAILWSRYVGEGETTLKVFQDQGGNANLYVDEVVQPDADGFLHVDVSGLIPWMHYRFCVVATNEAEVTRSAIGRFRTAPAADALVPVVFGGVSCTHTFYKPFKPLLRAAEAELDFFILAGDTTYNDGAKSLSEYQNDWTENLESDGHQALFRATSMLSTWDDHEVDNNWDPETIDAGQLAAARQAFFQFTALRRDLEDADRIWRSFRWGKTVEVFVLDCRGERKPSTRGTPEAQYISPAQMSWLKDGLSASEAMFKIIVNSVPITDMPNFFFSESDRWEGYGPQRDEILAHIELDPDPIPGCVWVSGDFHFGAIARIATTGLGANAYEIYMGPGGQFPNPAYLLLNAPAQKDQFKLATGTHNYVRFTADPTTSPPALTIEFVSGDGDAFHTHVIEATG